MACAPSTWHAVPKYRGLTWHAPPKIQKVHVAYANVVKVKVWTNVVDVSGGRTPTKCILHYTTPLGFRNMTNAAMSAAEIWASLIPENALYGFGIYGTVKGPGSVF